MKVAVVVIAAAVTLAVEVGVAMVAERTAVAVAIRLTRARHQLRVQRRLPSVKPLRRHQLLHGRRAGLMTWTTIFRFDLIYRDL